LRALRKRKPQETQAIAFEWKPGFTFLTDSVEVAMLLTAAAALQDFRLVLSHQSDAALST